MAITKLQRWLDLVAFLVSRRMPATFEEIIEHVPAYSGAGSGDMRAGESVRRMFERDKDELRAMGIPLQTVPFSIGFGSEAIEGYAIDNRDFYLPWLRLVEQLSPGGQYADRNRTGEVEITPAEAPLVLEALRRVSQLPASPLAREARSAFRKLAFDLDPDAFAADSPVLFVERPEAEELVERLRMLSDALLTRKRVAFTYHGIYRGEDTDRSVQPYGLLFQEGHWYLVAHDAEREAVRVFRVGRMDALRVNPRAPHTPDYEIPAGFKLDPWVGRKAWELGDLEEKPIEADVRFRFPRSLWAERNGHGALVRELEGGDTVRRFRVYQVGAFLRWLLGLGGEADVLEPAELAQQFRELAADVARIHGGGDDA